MGKIVKLDTGADRYLASAQKKYDDGRLIDAIADYRRVIELDPKNKTAYSEMSRAYADLGCGQALLTTNMRMIALDRKWDEGYLGMIEYGAMNERADVLFYYFHLGIETGALSDDEDYKFPSPDEFAGTAEKPRFSLYEGGDGGSARFARAMLFGGQYEIARTVYEGIDKNSKDYREARVGIICTLYSLGKYDECIEKCNEFLKETPDSMPVISTKMLAYFESGRYDEAYAAGDELDALGAESEADVYAVAVAFMKAQDDDYAAKYFEKLLEYRPYDHNCLLVIAQAEYNLGMKAEAREDATILRKLYPDDRTAEYYARKIVLGKVKEFDLSTELPPKEAAAREKRVDGRFRKIDTLSAAVKALDEDEVFREETEWLLREGSNYTGVSVAKFLCQSEKWQPYVRDLLIDSGISVAARREILHSYLCCAKDKNYEIASGEMLILFSPVVPKADDTREENETYWRVVAAMSFATHGFDEKVAAAYEKIVSALRKANVKKCNGDALAALILYEAHLDEYADKRRCCEAFDASVGGFNALRSRIGLARKAIKTASNERDDEKGEQPE